jgi:hypothetical protein
MEKSANPVRFGFKKKIGSLSEYSVPVIFISMLRSQSNLKWNKIYIYKTNIKHYTKIENVITLSFHSMAKTLTSTIL